MHCSSLVFWSWINRTSIFFYRPTSPQSLQWHNKWKSYFLPLQTYLPECLSAPLPFSAFPFLKYAFTFISLPSLPSFFKAVSNPALHVL